MIVAAGSGSRLAAGIPKAFVEVGGRTLLEHAVSRVAAAGCVDEIVVVVPPSHVEQVQALPGLRDCGVSVFVASGGPSRQASVHRGIAALSPGVDVVLVHDAARCLTPPALVRAVAEAVRDGDPAVVPVVPVSDTIRSVDGGLVDRSRLRAVQTPQGFSRDLLERAHDEAAAFADDETVAATDDAGLVERIGGHVLLVPGDPRAFKVTTPLDLTVATALLTADPDTTDPGSTDPDAVDAQSVPAR